MAGPEEISKSEEEVIDPETVIEENEFRVCPVCDGDPSKYEETNGQKCPNCHGDGVI